MLIIPVPIIFRVIEFCNSIKRDPIYNFNLLFFFSEFQNPVKKKIEKEFNFQYSRPTFKLLSKQNLSLNIIETISPYFSPFSILLQPRYPTTSVLSRTCGLSTPPGICLSREDTAGQSLPALSTAICILRSCSHRSRGLFAALYSYDRIKRTSPSRNEQSCSIQPTRS